MYESVCEKGEGDEWYMRGVRVVSGIYMGGMRVVSGTWEG